MFKVEDRMKVFVSWSGSLSCQVAETLRRYLPLMMQGLEVFMSEHDVESGSRWSVELARKLDESSFRVLCLTFDNLQSAWLLFEAGALAKQIEGRTCGLLIGGLKPTDVGGPLAQFQHRRFVRDEFNVLVCDINRKLDRPLEATSLQMIFEKWWPDIEREYELALETSAVDVEQTHRDERDLLEEILLHIRTMERDMNWHTTHARLSQSSWDTLSPLLKAAIDLCMSTLTDFQRPLLRERVFSK
jgi:TIR domain